MQLQFHLLYSSTRYWLAIQLGFSLAAAIFITLLIGNTNRLLSCSSRVIVRNDSLLLCYVLWIAYWEAIFIIFFWKLKSSFMAIPCVPQEFYFNKKFQILSCFLSLFYKKWLKSCKSQWHTYSQNFCLESNLFIYNLRMY